MLRERVERGVSLPLTFSLLLLFLFLFLSFFFLFLFFLLLLFSLFFSLIFATRGRPLVMKILGTFYSYICVSFCVFLLFGVFLENWSQLIHVGLVNVTVQSWKESHNLGWCPRKICRKRISRGLLSNYSVYMTYR